MVFSKPLLQHSEIYPFIHENQSTSQIQLVIQDHLESHRDKLVPLISKWGFNKNLNLIDILGVELSSILYEIKKNLEGENPDFIKEISLPIHNCHQFWLYFYIYASGRHSLPKDVLSITSRFPKFHRAIDKFRNMGLLKLENLLNAPEGNEFTGVTQKRKLQLITQQKRFDKTKDALNRLKLWWTDYLEPFYSGLIEEDDNDRELFFKMTIDTNIEAIFGKDIPIEKPSKEKICQYAKYVSTLFYPDIDTRTNQNEIVDLGLHLPNFKALSSKIINIISKPSFTIEELYEVSYEITQDTLNLSRTQNPRLESTIQSIREGTANRQTIFGENARKTNLPPEMDKLDLLGQIHSFLITMNLFGMIASDLHQAIEEFSGKNIISFYLDQLMFFVQEPHNSIKANEKETQYPNLDKAIRQLQSKLTVKNKQNLLKISFVESNVLKTKIIEVKDLIERETKIQVSLLAQKGDQAFSKTKAIIEEEAICKYVEEKQLNMNLEATSVAQEVRKELAERSFGLINEIGLIRSAHIVAFLGDKELPPPFEDEDSINLLPESFIDLLSMDGLEEKLNQAWEKETIDNHAESVTHQEEITLPFEEEEKPTPSDEILPQIDSYDPPPKNKVRKLRKWLIENGFMERTGKGSHTVYVHPQSGKNVVVPHHERLKPGTQLSVEQQIEKAWREDPKTF